MPRTGRPAHRHVDAVTRALSVLDALSDGRDELGTNEIARRTGINPSTVSRLLATLAAARLVEHVAETGRYRLGLRLVELGNAVLERLDLRQIARPHLEALVAVTRETPTLSVPGGDHAITIDFVAGPHSVQSVAQIGRPSAAHATATGKVMLAFRAGELPAVLTSYTRRTITTGAQLAKELDRVRTGGFAQSVGEREEDLNAVAAPIWDSRNDLVAIVSVQGPAARFGAKAMRDALEPLRAAAEAISSELGGRIAR